MLDARACARVFFGTACGLSVEYFGVGFGLRWITPHASPSLRLQDSDFGAVSLYAGLLDITDEAWTTANLSDDGE